MSLYRGIPSVTEEVECGGSVHRVTWEDGTITALDHDVDAEKALVSLGGELPACVQIVEAWQWGSHDLETISFVLQEYEIPLETVIATNLANLQISFANIKASVAGTHPAVLSKLQESIDQGRKRLHLVSLPRGLKNRLELEMMAGLEQKLGVTDDSPRPSETDQRELQSRHAQRATAESLLARWANPEIEKCMRAWRRIPTRSIITVETWVIDPGEEPSLSGWFSTDGGFAAASLPLSWLRRVWATDLALVDGCFILDIEEDIGRYRRATAARWERQHTEIGDRSVPVVGDVLVIDRESGKSLRWLDPST